MAKPLDLRVEYGKWRNWRAKLGLLLKQMPKPIPAPKPKPLPTPLKGCDYVHGPSVATLKAAGIRFVCRYLSTPGNPKNLTVVEAKSLHAGGISIVLVFETTANRALGGHAAGIADANSAHAQAAALGHPSAVVYFAADFDPHGHESVIVDYIRGAASVLTSARTGIYGGFAAVKACLAAKACTFGWQTYAWSGGVWYPGSHIEQYQNGARIGGASVDLDRALKANYGQWAP